MLFIALLGLTQGGAAEQTLMPDCHLTALDGGTAYTLQTLRNGQVIYVDFWASWCSSCAKSFKFLNALAEDLRDQGLAVLGINLDEDPQDAQRFLERFPARFTVVADPGGQCARAFGVEGMPASYVIDRRGIVRYGHVGFRSGEAKALRQKIEQLLSESDADG